ncbi:MAG: sulfotransferase [Phycisphaerales bacterium]|nr:sulfotransferase [Phycisphaerales bacterium]
MGQPSGFGATSLDRAAARLSAGDPAGAIERCRQILRRTPDDPPALRLLAQAQLVGGEIEGARHSLRRLIALEPTETAHARQLAMTLRQEARLPEAHEVLDAAISKAPDDCALRASKAELCFLQGEYAAAAEVLGPCLGLGALHPAAAQAFARLAPRLDPRELAIGVLRSTIAASSDPRTRSRLLFETGRLLDALGRYDPAFAAYDEANRLKPAQLDEQAYADATHEMLQSWTRESASTPLEPDQGAEGIVFIVGMPRSGTSLIEQMLASHPQIRGGGERTDIDAIVHQFTGPGARGINLVRMPQQVSSQQTRRLAHDYAQTVAKARAEASILTDKAPFNFMHLGLIQKICPRAKVIHCEREPLDTCLSIFFNNLVGFHSPPPDLRRIGERYRLYEQVMAHWARTLSLPMLSLRYEEVVEQPEAQARRLIDFVGVPWDDAVLRFHENRRVVLTPSADQVRRPIYDSSRGRWRHYERHLAPLRAGLAGVSEDRADHE